MNKAIWSLAAAIVVVLLGCSNDDDAGSNCESCTSSAGTKLEICDNGNGTYDISDETETERITEEELLGLTPKLFIETACAIDGEEITF